MAAVAVSKLAVPKYVGLKAGEVAKPCTARSSARPVQSKSLVCVSSMESVASKVGKVMVGVSAGVLLGASSAFAASVTVKMGGDDGTLAFIPKTISIASGDTISFVNNAAFPHNIVFDSDEVPSGVDSDAISHNDKFYCEPHQGVGMAGEITVN